MDNLNCTEKPHAVMYAAEMSKIFLICVALRVATFMLVGKFNAFFFIREIAICGVFSFSFFYILSKFVIYEISETEIKIVSTIPLEKNRSVAVFDLKRTLSTVVSYNKIKYNVFCEKNINSASVRTRIGLRWFFVSMPRINSFVGLSSSSKILQRIRGIEAQLVGNKVGII